jgi:hypothetical protein
MSHPPWALNDLHSVPRRSPACSPHCWISGSIYWFKYVDWRYRWYSDRYRTGSYTFKRDFYIRVYMTYEVGRVPGDVNSLLLHVCVCVCVTHTRKQEHQRDWETEWVPWTSFTCMYSVESLPSTVIIDDTYLLVQDIPWKSSFHTFLTQVFTQRRSTSTTIIGFCKLGDSIYCNKWRW